MKVVNAIRDALQKLLETEKEVLIIGQDIIDPYGGAFKITKGLSSKYPERIISTPISEAGMVGLATGLAIDGFKPIIEIMFGDFIGLTFDQLLNHASKYPQMFEGKTCSVVIRTPMGGRRGYGPTHSQTIEKHFLGIPKLNVLAINQFIDFYEFYKYAINKQTPTLIIENKIMYNDETSVIIGDVYSEQYDCWLHQIEDYSYQAYFDQNTKPDATIITYGGMSKIVIQSALELLLNHEIYSDIFILSDLNGDFPQLIQESINNSNILITIEEGTKTLPVGNHFLSKISQNNKINFYYLPITASDSIIPASKNLENEVLPSKNLIVKKIKKAVMSLNV